MKATIDVEVTGATIVVHARYQNLSKAPIYIKKGLFGVGRQDRDKASSRGSLDEFVIKAPDGRYLRYEGLMVNFALPPTKEEDFTPVAPGEIMTSSVSLGPEPSGPLVGRYVYHFLTGTHTYEVVALYKIFDEEENAIKTLRTEPSTFTLTMPEGKP